MKELDDIISSVGKSHHSRTASKNKKIVKFLENKYPSYPIKDQVSFYRNGLISEPRCKFCNGILKNIRKSTCSHKCRISLQKQTGKMPAIVAKRKATCFEKYGVSNHMKLADFQEKRINSMIDKYGAKVSNASREAIKKRHSDLLIKGKKSLFESHGVTNPGQLKDHRSKCIATMQKNYGVDHYTKSDEFKRISEKKRLSKWNDFTPSSIKIHDVDINHPTDRIKFTCECGGQETLSHETLKWRTLHVGTPCVKCGDLDKGSLKEKKIAEWLSSVGIEFSQNDRTIINGKELDIYIKSANLAIEFNGLFWHNDLRIDKNYHLDKTNKCERLGIRLIHIFEDEWDNFSEICKSRILYALDMENDTIYARKCTVSKISTKDAKEFLSSYHLQGHSPASIKFGLYYEGELISVMTFGRSSAKKFQWELLRFCSKINVIGGASRLFKSFIREHNPSSVISLCDKRWGIGKVYETMGFQYIGDSKPGYWYAKGVTRTHRRLLRKTKDDPNDITEYELRLNEGYYRIWDCGHKKYRWNKGD